MRNMMLLLAIACTQVEAGEISRQAYLELIQEHPGLVKSQGDFTQGEIQIVLDPQEMAVTEKEIGRDVGVVMRDKYWLWVNDACIFPNGHKGVYGRILCMNSLEAHPGAVVMLVMPDGTIAVICTFRHATRSWEIELPRGGINPGEDIRTAAKREAFEETGMVVDDLVLLGEMTPDTGILGAVVPVFMAKVIDQQKAEQEESEAIEEVLFLTVQEIKQAFVQGYYEHRIRGIPKRIPCRDPFLAYAILLYESTKT